MNNLELKDMTDKEKYSAINYKDYGDKVFINSNKSSLSFFKYHNEDNLRDYLLEILKNRFDLNDDKLEEKFKEAVSGDGKELNRISTLISSSLCAFLHFYNVSDSHPLKIKKEILGLEEDKENKESKKDIVEFTDVHFEVKNKVFKKSKMPSNIDIMLISKNKEYVLFLESKFSEYLMTQLSINVSCQYKDIYDKINIYNCLQENNQIKVKTRENDEKCYFEGLQQFIAHYIGVCNFVNGEFEQNKKTRKKFQIPDNCQVILGEIVFDGWGKNSKAFEQYNTKFNELANVLTQITKDDNQKKLKIITKLLTYQELFGDNEDNIKLLNEKIRKFYKYD